MCTTNDICNGNGEVQSVQRSFLGQVVTARVCLTCRGFAEAGDAGLDGQLAAARHRFAGVDSHVDQDLLDLARVCEDQRQGVCQVGDQLDVLAQGADQ